MEHKRSIGRDNKHISKETITKIVRDNLCCGCGTCVVVCPRAAISISVDVRQSVYLPRIDENRCNHCGTCIEVCSGLGIDLNQVSLATIDSKLENPYLGRVTGCYAGYATDYEMRYSSASGGLITALLVYALEHGIIDGAMITTASEKDPLYPYSYIARTREEIVKGRTSRYCPVPVM
jgi:coenzyme F420 hydrogenase subunit beta